MVIWAEISLHLFPVSNRIMLMSFPTKMNHHEKAGFDFLLNNRKEGSILEKHKIRLILKQWIIQEH